MKNLLLLCFISFLFLLGACEYAPDGSYFEEMNPEPTFEAYLNLDAAGDTVFVRGSKDLEFSISLPGRQVLEYQVYLGEELLNKDSQPLGRITIRSAQFQNGYHSLKLLVRANSGTGSLGDVAGAELLEVYRVWIVEIRNGKPDPVQFTELYEEEGRLRIEWEKYDKPDFKQYLLYKNERYDFAPFVSITDPDQTFWVDSSYVGGDALYTVVVQVQEGPGSEKSFVEYSGPLSAILQHEVTGGNDVLLKFRPNPYYNNFGKYILRGYPDGEWVLSLEIESRLDTAILIKDIGFGGKVHFTLKTIPENEKFFFDNRQPEERYPVAIGNLYPYGKPAYYVAGTDTYYGFIDEEEGRKFFSADGNRLEKKEARPAETIGYGENPPWTISPDGKWLYIMEGGDILQLDPQTLEETATVPLNELMKTSYVYSVLNLNVSNNNRLAMSVRNRSLQDSVFLFDMNTKKSLLRKRTPYYPENAIISPDGKLFAHGWGSRPFYLEDEQGNWGRKENISHPELAFHPHEPHYAVSENTQVSLFSTATTSFIKGFETEVPLYNLQFDPANGNLGGTGDGGRYFYVYDPVTGSLLKKIKLVENATIKLFKHNLFSYEYYLPLEN